MTEQNSPRLMKEDFEPFLKEFAKAFKSNSHLVRIAEKVLNSQPPGTFTRGQVKSEVLRQHHAAELAEAKKSMQTRAWR